MFANENTILSPIDSVSTIVEIFSMISSLFKIKIWDIRALFGSESLQWSVKMFCKFLFVKQ